MDLKLPSSACVTPPPTLDAIRKAVLLVRESEAELVCFKCLHSDAEMAYFLTGCGDHSTESRHAEEARNKLEACIARHKRNTDQLTAMFTPAVLLDLIEKAEQPKARSAQPKARSAQPKARSARPTA